LLALALLVPGATCGGQDAVQSFADSYAKAVCRRAFECCTPADAMAALNAATESACVAKLGANSSKIGPELIATGQLRFDSTAASQCLKDLEGACSAVFDPRFGRVIPCNDVFVGAVPLGGPCDDDFVCASSDCEGQQCIVRPNPCAAVTCAADQFCDGTGACQPRGGVGADCHAVQCASDLTCVASTTQCATPGADGDTCTSPFDCAGSCTQMTYSPGKTGTCRPGLCQGS
jgi:hypothetical protein